ncbi:MAG: hypothetical protein ABR540_13540 [Acidimicrobiales bacterium]
MQLSLEITESPAPPGAMWESLAPEERVAVIATLARLMARSIDDGKEKRD